MAAASAAEQTAGEGRVKFGIAKTIDEKIELITRNLDEGVLFVVCDGRQRQVQNKLRARSLL